MTVVVLGGHGQIARRLLRLLTERGHVARGVVRNPEHVAELERLGAQAVVLDLERDELTDAVRGADAVVFAAGAGAGSGPERKGTVDLGGAVKLIDACRAEGVARYLMISAMGAADPSAGSEAMRPYLEAKAEADRRLTASGLDFTIVRPGSLTDEEGTGRIDAAPSLGRRGEVTRDDVAQTLLAVLGAPNAVGKTFEVLGGQTPVAEAVAAL